MNRPLVSLDRSRQARAAVTLLVAAATAAGAACKDQRTPTLPAKIDPIPDSAEQVIFGMRTYLLTNGVVRGELFADTAFTYDAGNRLELRGVKLYSFSATGDSTATMTGRSGSYDVRTGKVEGRGDVKVVAKDGRTLTSPRLFYDQVAAQISSDTVFQASQPGRNLSGVGFRSDPGLRNVTVLSGARGVTSVGKGKGGARK